MDGFAGVAFDGRQYNFRVSRRLRPNPLETVIGPLEIEILEGLRRHRLTLRPNESGLAFDLEFVATMNPHEEGEHFRRRNGRVTRAYGARAATRRLSRLDRGRRRAPRGRPRRPGSASATIPGAFAREMRTDETNPPLTYYPPVLLLLDDGAVQGPGAACVLQGARAGRQDLYLRRRGARGRNARPRTIVRLEDVSHDVVWAQRSARPDAARRASSKRASPTARTGA